jgi:HAD superfamily hydrolase (TIGR01490 family)
VSAPKAAFFDVDETLISVKSMFSFLGFYLDQRGHDENEFEVRSGRLRDMAAGGVTRNEVNRSFYTNFTGEPVADILDMGAQWYRQESKRTDFYHAVPLAELIRLRNGGTHVVLVSGSFRACLDPIASAVGAHQVFGTELESTGGLFTGHTGTPMIGHTKAETLLDTARQHGFDVAECVAYGDHASDLPMLRAAGKAVVVGNDPVLTDAARVHGWQQLPLQ